MLSVMDLSISSSRFRGKSCIEDFSRGIDLNEDYSSKFYG